MRNAHLRIGRLEYHRSTAKTSTRISVHVSHYIGENEQAHLISLFGNDAEIAAVTAAIQESHHFDLFFPDGSKQRIGFGSEASCYKANLSLSERKRSLRHLLAVSSWLHANGSAGRTFILNDEPKTQDLEWATLVSLLGMPADPRWGTYILAALRRERKLVPLSGIGCAPVVIQAAREELLERVGHACAAGLLPFPEKNGPVVWPIFEIKDALVLSS